MKILIITHGLLAKGLVDSVQLIIGEQEDLKYFSLLEGNNVDDFKKEIEKEIIETEGNVLCLTDIISGSPFNIVTALMFEHNHIHHVSGVNLSMVLEASLSKDVEIEELKEKVKEAGKNSIVDGGAYIKERMN